MIIWPGCGKLTTTPSLPSPIKGEGIGAEAPWENVFYKETSEGIILSVRAQPGASKDEIVGQWADSLKIRITAPPEKGKANEAIIKLLAEVLGLKKSAFKIVSGETFRDKKVLIQGISLPALEPQLKALRTRG